MSHHDNPKSLFTSPLIEPDRERQREIRAETSNTQHQNPRRTTTPSHRSRRDGRSCRLRTPSIAGNAIRLVVGIAMSIPTGDGKSLGDRVADAGESIWNAIKGVFGG